MKKALILGISGQDGSYLAEHLLDLNYQVHGVIRRHSFSENQTSRIEHFRKNLTCHYGDILDQGSIFNIINQIKPDEIYNLAAMSHVAISSHIPNFTIQVNGLAVLNLLEIIRSNFPKIKFYQASSSEMFGNSIDSDKYQRLSTPMNPVSPYGCSKLLAYNLLRHYRNSYKLHLCTGVLFNHESPRRGVNFVTQKITKRAVEIKKGKEKELILGNLDAYRDWGHAIDYVKAIKKIVDYDEPTDWIVSTEITRSIRDLCKYTFNKLNLNYEDFVKQDQKFVRKEELEFLKGDSSKTRKLLNWKPEISFEEMIDEMIDCWMKKI